MREALAGFLLMNLASAVAIAVVLALRMPVRRWFGARVAYGLWALAPLAAATMLAPARVVTITEAAAAPVAATGLAVAAASAPAALAAFDAAPWLVALWLAGVLASALWLVRRQAQFSRAVRAGRAGPAVVGVLKPRIVLPADFEARYTPRERQVILAHEQTHIARQDPRINAAAAAVRCLAWFNPLVHLAVRYLRIDQELACDAQVVAAHPSARRSYAEAMLKTQLVAHAPPLGCSWIAPSTHPLAKRVGLLARALPGRRREAAGAAAVAGLALALGVSAWAARPPQVMVRTLAAEAPPAQPPAPAPVLAPASPDRPQPPAPPPPPPEAIPVAFADAPPPSDDPAPAASDPVPTFKIRGVAERSHVEPGSAVRVLATMTDPEGRRLITDLTAFGSQTAYRTGYVERDGSRFSLFTSVEQRGEMLYVTASLGPAFAPGTSGTLALASGQTGAITLGKGQVVTLTPTLRRETPEEAAEARQWGDWMDRRKLFVRAAFEHDTFRCGQPGAIC